MTHSPNATRGHLCLAKLANAGCCDTAPSKARALDEPDRKATEMGYFLKCAGKQVFVQQRQGKGTAALEPNGVEAQLQLCT
jgi:hypothetical protein